MLRLVGRLDAGEHLTLLITQVKLQTQQFVGAIDGLGVDDACHAQFDVEKVIDADVLLGFVHGVIVAVAGRFSAAFGLIQ